MKVDKLLLLLLLFLLLLFLFLFLLFPYLIISQFFFSDGHIDCPNNPYSNVTGLNMYILRFGFPAEGSHWFQRTTGSKETQQSLAKSTKEIILKCL